MKRFIPLVLCFGVFAGGTCSSSPALNCANDLDATADYGFRLTIPDGFECVPTNPLQAALVLARAAYTNSEADINAAVVVSEPQDDSGDSLDGVTDEDLGTTTNSHGVEFELHKLTYNLDSYGTQYSYSAGATLPDGKNLIITVSSEEDSTDLPDVLEEITDTVEFPEAS